MQSSRSNCLVVIASPTLFLRKRWKQELQRSFTVFTARTSQAIVELVERLRPAVLLLDLAYPTISKQISLILRISPHTKILAFTHSPDEKEAASLLKNGVRGYASINLDSVLLRKAIQMVQKGEIWIERKFISYALNELFNSKRRKRFSPQSAALEKLSVREHEIARSIGRGLSNKEIAEELGISEATVKAHITNIFLKLGLSDRLQVALYVQNIGPELISPRS